MTFDAPAVLLLAPLAALGVWLAATWARRVRLRRAARWSEETVRRALAAGRFGPSGLSLAALLAAVGLAGPRWGEERVVAQSRGLNLVIAVDISRSMLAEDARPSRLGRALREARRLVQDLDGDRLGLIAFAGSSYILSPVSLDGSAVTLHLDALDPDVASQGGSVLGPTLKQGAELLGAGADPADRVLVVFTDGEAHDSLPAITVEARRLADAGVHLIVVAEGRPEPVRIPIRDPGGALLRYHQDEDGEIVETRRRDDILHAVAEAAQGTIVPAELPDQIGAVRELVASYKRGRSTETRTQHGRPRAWIALLAAASVLLVQAASRRTAALIGVALALSGPLASAQAPRYPRTPAEKAWDKGDPRGAAEAYLDRLAGRADDRGRYNAGTAALAAGDAERARPELEQAASSLDPEIRFRALYNLGFMSLRLARSDSAHREGHLADAARAYREALRLNPKDLSAKWNLELAVREQRSRGSQSPPPPSGGGSGAPPPGRGDGGGSAGAGPGGGLNQAQAEEILRSIGQEELRTRRDRMGRMRRPAPAGVKDW